LSSNMVPGWEKSSGVSNEGGKKKKAVGWCRGKKREGPAVFSGGAKGMRKHRMGKEQE